MGEGEIELWPASESGPSLPGCVFGKSEKSSLVPIVSITHNTFFASVPHNGQTRDGAGVFASAERLATLDAEEAPPFLIGVAEIARCVYKTKDAVQVRDAPALERRLQAGIGHHCRSNLIPLLTHAVGLYSLHFRPGDELLAFEIHDCLEGLHAFPDHDKRFAGYGLAGLLWSLASVVRSAVPKNILCARSTVNAVSTKNRLSGLTTPDSFLTASHVRKIFDLS